MFCERYDEFVKALEKRRFLVHSAATAAEAKELGISLIGGGSVGFGGSVTGTELGLYETLQETPYIGIGNPTTPVRPKRALHMRTGSSAPRTQSHATAGL